MKLLFTLIFIFTASFCFAQKQNIYFLKNDGRLVDLKDSADFTRVVREPDSGSVLYNVYEFYPNGKRKMLGNSSTIDPVKLQGACVEFYNNGNKKAQGLYQDNKLVNDEYLFYPNGKIYQQRTHPAEIAKDENDNFSLDYLVKSCFDSLGTALVTDGNGYYKGFDNNFKNVNEEGTLVNGKRNGEWKGVEAGNTYTESYINGELQTGTAVRKSGETFTYTKQRGTTPHYKGGLNSFYSYLSNHIAYPDNAMRNNIQGRVILSFVVEKDGTLSSLKLLRSVDPEIDAEALRVMKKSPKWVPGTMFGQNVRVQYTIPVDFSIK